MSKETSKKKDDINDQKNEKKDLNQDKDNKVIDEKSNTSNEKANDIEFENVKSENVKDEVKTSSVDAEIKALRELNENFEKEVAELKDRLLRRAAEFDNYKRRVENEQFNLLKYAAENFIIKILPIYDDLTRSLGHINNEANSASIKDGLQMVLSKFSKILDDQGIKKIEAVGQPFDFNFHEALMQKTVEDIPPHTVVDELEPGYIYKDKVIRHSKVIVSDENSGQLLEGKN